MMCGYFCIKFINFILKDKTFLDYVNFFSPKEHEMNCKLLLKTFQKFEIKNSFYEKILKS